MQLSDHKLSPGRATIIALAAASLGMVAGGMVGIAAATYRWVQKAGATQETAGLAGIIPGFINANVLVLVSLVGLVHLLFVHQLTALQAVSFGFILFLLGGIAGVFTMGIPPSSRDGADYSPTEQSLVQNTEEGIFPGKN